MGVPMAVCPSEELPFPPFIFQFLLFVSYIQRAVHWALLALGLGVLPDDRAPSFSAPAHHHQSPHPRRRPARHFPTSTLIRQALPSFPYKTPPAVPKDEYCQDPDQIFTAERCAVCVHGLEAGEEVRRMGGCRHDFHTCCIDSWIDIGGRTCPLCRAELASQEMLRQAMAAAGEVFGEDTANIFTNASHSRYSSLAYHDNDDGLY